MKLLEDVSGKQYQSGYNIIMNKKEFYKKCICKEVYWPYNETGPVNPILKLWCRYFRPESNACFLVRKYLYHSHSKSKVSKFLSKLYEIKLMRRYNIWIHPDADIDIGLRFIHPSCIFITNSKIGKNFTILQGTTVGVKKIGLFQRENCPHIGDNVTMYAGSSIVGKVNIADGVTVAGHACVVTDAMKDGIYIGVPAKLKG